MAQRRNSRPSLAMAVISLMFAGCGSSVPTPTPTPAPATAKPPAGSPGATPTPSSSTEVRSTPKVEPTQTDTVGPILQAQFGAAGIAFFDAQRGLVVGAGGMSGTSGVVRRTSDGGRTWGPTTTLDSGPLVSVAVVAPNRAWAAASCRPEAGAGCIDGLFRSDDRGATWTRISSKIVASPSFVDLDDGWGILGATEPGASPAPVGATHDGGRTWTRVANGCPARFGGPVAVSFVDREHGWLGCNYTIGAGGAFKGIAETKDAGRHWTVRSGTSGDQGSVGSISWSDYLFALAMRPNGTGLWLGQRGTTARTSTSGKTWAYGPPGDPDADIASGVSLISDRTWFLVMWLAEAQETTLERSDDAGRHWTIVGPIGPP